MRSRPTRRSSRSLPHHSASPTRSVLLLPRAGWRRLRPRSGRPRKPTARSSRRCPWRRSRPRRSSPPLSCGLEVANVHRQTLVLQTSGCSRHSSRSAVGLAAASVVRPGTPARRNAARCGCAHRRGCGTNPLDRPSARTRWTPREPTYARRSPRGDQAGLWPSQKPLGPEPSARATRRSQPPSASHAPAGENASCQSPRSR